LAAATRRERGLALLIGAIADDLGDYRPGMKAAGEAGARWPLARPPYLLETSLPGVFAVGEGSTAIAFVHRVLGE